MPAENIGLAIRIVAENPVPGLAIALQQGSAEKATLVPSSITSSTSIGFDELTIGGVFLTAGRGSLSLMVNALPQARSSICALASMRGRRTRNGLTA